MAGSDLDDPTWHLLLFIAAIALVVWLIWHFFKVELLEIVRYVRLLEMYAVALFDQDARNCVTWLRIASTKAAAIPRPEVIHAAMQCYGSESLKSLPPQDALQYYNLTPKSFGVMTGIVQNYIRVLAVAIIGGIGYYALYMSPRNKFKTRHTLESLIQVQSKMWPVIQPIVKFNPTKHSARAPGDRLPDKLPIFAEALSPEEWISFHRIKVENGIPEREMVRRALLQQLGPRWNGFNGLPIHVLGLIAAFALMGAQKRDECEDLLGRLATQWDSKTGYLMQAKLASEVKEILYDKDLGGAAGKVMARYAYRTTAMLGVLKWARYQGGVLAPAHFLWLRAVDRNLWYPLNNLGRRAFHTEGAGAMAHFMAEEAAGKPLPIPRIDTAIVTINQYLAERQARIPPHA